MSEKKRHFQRFKINNKSIQKLDDKTKDWEFNIKCITEKKERDISRYGDGEMKKTDVTTCQFPVTDVEASGTVTELKELWITLGETENDKYVLWTGVPWVIPEFLKIDKIKGDFPKKCSLEHYKHNIIVDCL